LNSRKHPSALRGILEGVIKPYINGVIPHCLQSWIHFLNSGINTAKESPTYRMPSLGRTQLGYLPDDVGRWPQ
jgi:hypothetical protein